MHIARKIRTICYCFHNNGQHLKNCIAPFPYILSHSLSLTSAQFSIFYLLHLYLFSTPLNSPKKREKKIPVCKNIGLHTKTIKKFPFFIAYKFQFFIFQVNKLK